MQTIGSDRTGFGSLNGCASDQVNGWQGHTDCPNNVSGNINNNRNESGHGNQVVFCGLSVYGRPAEFYGLCTRSGNVYPRIDCPPELTLERLEEGSIRAVNHPNRHLSRGPGTTSGSDSDSAPGMDARLQAICQDQNQVNEGCSWSDHCPPLLLAAKEQNALLVRTALLNGARISETFEGMNVLNHAVEQCNMAILDELAQHPDFKIILNAMNSSGATPLIQSVALGNCEMTGRLLELGARIDQTRSGKNALQYAVENGDLDTLNALAQHRDFKRILDVRNNDGKSPLMQAVDNGNWQITQRLLLLGADYKDSDNAN